MAATTFDSIIVPEIWVPYVLKRTMEKSALVQSGIVENDAEFNRLASQAGPLVNMPFWADLTGESESYGEGDDLTPDGIAARKDVAAIIRRAKAWSSTDLAAAMSGSDPAKAIAELVSDFWVRDMQKELIAELKGIFIGRAASGNDPAVPAAGKDLINDISGGSGAAAKISASAVIDTAQLLGDAKDVISTIVMHSATETALRKQNLIEYVQPSNDVAFGVYQGKRVIVDDGCPVEGTGANAIFTTYMFGNGAFGLGNGSPVGFVPVETDRAKLKGSGINYLINRKQYILHARGFKFTGTEYDEEKTPTRTELALPENYNLVYEPKQVRVVALRHKI
jgi:hypothetical protein